MVSAQNRSLEFGVQRPVLAMGRSSRPPGFGESPQAGVPQQPRQYRVSETYTAHSTGPGGLVLGDNPLSQVLLK